MPKPTLDAFVWALMRQAREFGQQEERERVIAYLEGYQRPDIASRIAEGQHDGGRTFTAYRWTWPEDEDENLPASGVADASNVNHAAPTPQETPCQSASTKAAKPHRA